ncbi:hypothetical protein [Bradyrhizobium stylosanthis]|uniref:Uncharacterized protein n=1 Tax=Bradyrhizobium stylosanthis TaxID=1803665 RepID=A0A560CXJ5_9BRAD|nr:hypothetical protein [Bradyrhizobium stylosanthis]TWA89584.1 hypothetical protein FBZ96_11952 [Bradyrhizobium stylosanthis]
MCLSGGSPPKDNSAEIARQQAQDRENKVNQGKASIDSAFSVFDPAYYDKYKQTYLDNYNPEVDRQFGVAKQQTQYNLARAGTTDATIGQKQFGDLVRNYGQQKQNIASQAIDATNKLRTDVENQKTALYGQNSASADPSLASISALSNANSLSQPAQLSPLGSVFAGLTNGIAYGVAGANNKLPAGYANAFAPGATLPGGNGSGRVVG